MKRMYFVFILFSFVLLSSFRCATGTWSFVVSFQFVDPDDGHNIEGLDVNFDPKLYKNGSEVVFEARYNNSTGNKKIKDYMAIPEIYSLNEISADDRYLDCVPIQYTMNTYRVVVTDPSGVYKEYKSPSLQELLENSDDKDRKLSMVDENGYTHFQELAFKIPLEKYDQVGNT